MIAFCRSGSRVCFTALFVCSTSWTERNRHTYLEWEVQVNLSSMIRNCFTRLYMHVGGTHYNWQEFNLVIFYHLPNRQIKVLTKFFLLYGTSCGTFTRKLLDSSINLVPVLKSNNACPEPLAPQNAFLFPYNRIYYQCDSQKCITCFFSASRLVLIHFQRSSTSAMVRNWKAGARIIDCLETITCTPPALVSAVAPRVAEATRAPSVVANGQRA